MNDQFNLADIVGKPYKIGGRGPNAFDCWGLVRYVYKELLNIELPVYAGFTFKSNYTAKINREIFKKQSQWQIVENPEPWGCVAMSKNKIIDHIGLWIEQEKICLHASLGCKSVVAHSLPKLRQIGFNKMLFLRYKND